MKKRAFPLIICMSLLAVSAEAGVTANKSTYEYERAQLSDPWLFNRTVEACSHLGITPEVQQKLSRLMGVAEANVRLEFCHRILSAYAKGAVSYDDYVQFSQGHIMSASIARALRVNPGKLGATRQDAQEIILPATAKMDSGERFTGKTVAAHGTGHFQVQSSRHAVSCAGSYDLGDRRPTVTLPVKCSDGRTGNVTVTRTSDMMSAQGLVKLSDGSKGRVTVGRAVQKAS
jgi:hypothetical protein